MTRSRPKSQVPKSALDGNEEGARVHVTPDLERAAALNEFVGRSIAEGYALIGRNDDAVMWARTAVDRSFINYPSLSRHDPFLETVRSDPRFQQLMEEVRPRWESIIEWEQRSKGAP